MLIFCDTPVEPFPPFANDMAIIGRVVHLQARVTRQRMDDWHQQALTYTSTKCAIHAPCILPITFSMSACRPNESKATTTIEWHDEHSTSNGVDPGSSSGLRTFIDSRLQYHSCLLFRRFIGVGRDRDLDKVQTLYRPRPESMAAEFNQPAPNESYMPSVDHDRDIGAGSFETSWQQR